LNLLKPIAMAEIINESATPQRGKRRARLLPVHIDMTPMVDLACLLLTFFILTAAFNKPKVMEIVMPSGKPTKVNPGKALTIILAENDQIFFYNGHADPSEGKLPTMIKSNFTENGLRKVLLSRNKDLFDKSYYLNDSVAKSLGEYSKYSKDEINRKLRRMRSEDKTGPLVLIKAAEGVKYGNIVDVLDKMAITNVARYAVVDINYVEKKMLKDALEGKNVEIQ
jgi:biopolymer transport protein ExbD